MKIKVTITVEVNQEAWAKTYGIEKQEVRKDVSEWAKVFVAEAVENMGLNNDK